MTIAEASGVGFFESSKELLLEGSIGSVEFVLDAYLSLVVPFNCADLGGRGPGRDDGCRPGVD